MQTVFRLTNHLLNAAMVVAGVAVVLMMLHVTADVLSRPFMARPLPGTTLIVSDYYMVACAFLPLAFAQMAGAHISMDVTAHLLPGRAQYHMAGLALVIACTIFGLLTYSASLDAMTKYRINSFAIEFGTRIPTWPSYFLLPVGCALMTLVSAIKLIEYVTGRLTPPD